MRQIIASALAVGSLAGLAFAQPVARLDLRILPQTGSPPGVSEAPPVDSSGARLTIAGVKRFEVQYRLIDISTVSTAVPAGLHSLVMNITCSDPTAGVFTRAVLSNSEANAGARPPRSPGQPLGTVAWLGGPASDTSQVNPTGRAGLHSPFRNGLSNVDDNALAANGTIVSGAINSINPLSLSQNNQGREGFDLSPDQDATHVLTGGEWYGLFSFNFTPTPGLAADFTINATVVPDADTQDRFTFFNAADSTLVQSVHSTDGLAFLRVVPSPSGLAVLGLAALACRRRALTPRR